MEIYSEEIVGKLKITKGRTSNGVFFEMREPIHTPEEQQEIIDNFLQAAAKIVYPGIDLSRVSKITMICD